MGDFLPVGRENGLGTIFVTGVDWYKHGGGFSVVWKSSESESSDSEIGLTLGFFCYERRIVFVSENCKGHWAGGVVTRVLEVFVV